MRLSSNSLNFLVLLVLTLVWVSPAHAEFLFGGDQLVEDRLDEDLYVLAERAEIDALVAGDILVIAGEVYIGEGGVVGGNSRIVGEEIIVEGALGALDETGSGSSVTIVATRVLINGNIAGDLDIRADFITIGPDAFIDGSLTYDSPNDPNIDLKAEISGDVIREGRLFNRVQGPWSGVAYVYAGPSAGLVQAVGLIAWSILVIGAGVAMPGFVVRQAGGFLNRPVATVFFGIILPPGLGLIMLMLMITVIGIPIAALLAGLTAAGMVLAYLMAHLLLGEVALRLAGRLITQVKTRLPEQGAKRGGLAAVAGLVLALGLDFLGGWGWLVMACLTFAVIGVIFLRFVEQRQDKLGLEKL